MKRFYTNLQILKRTILYDEFKHILRRVHSNIELNKMILYEFENKYVRMMREPTDFPKISVVISLTNHNRGLLYIKFKWVF